MIGYQKVIIFGSTGAIGRHLIEILVKEQPTWQITAVTRDPWTGTFDGMTNVNVVEGDPNSREQVLELSRDQDIIYSCVGFDRYEAKYWGEHWPIVVDNLLEASTQKPNQKLVFGDNLYAYGPTMKISPQSPIVAPSTTSKPGVRAFIHKKFEKRIMEQENPIVIVGASDFFGPYVTKTSMLGDVFTKVIIESKPRPIALGSASAVHDFAYAPDFSRALYIASIHDAAYGKFWICPHSIRNKTISSIAQDIAHLVSSTNSKVNVIPGWGVRILGLVIGFMKEMVEMLPFWTNDYMVDDSDFCRTFGVTATPYEQALQEYVTFYQSQQ